MESVLGAEFSIAVDETEWLLRLNFSPEHIKDGEVVPAAISLSDLKSRGFSIDREHLLDAGAMRARVEAQQVKAPESRAQSFLSRFECGPVRLESGGDGHAAFVVDASPLDDNKAHAHILSAVQRGEGALRRLRLRLVSHLQRLISLDEYMKPKDPQGVEAANPVADTTADG